MSKRMMTIAVLILSSMVCSPIFSMALFERDPIAAAIEQSNAKEFKNAFHKQYPRFHANQMGKKQIIDIASKALDQLKEDAHEILEDRDDINKNRALILAMRLPGCSATGSFSALGLTIGLRGITNNMLGLRAFCTTAVRTATARQVAAPAKLFFTRDLAQNSGLVALSIFGLYVSFKWGSQAYQAWNSKYYLEQAQTIQSTLENINAKEKQE
ncbi:MAG: hypothetical protein WCE21_05455 [Candidatus Babeliales bacterium]